MPEKDRIHTITLEDPIESGIDPNKLYVHGTRVNNIRDDDIP